MAHTETLPLHDPFERLGHTVKAIPPWAGRHWKSLSLTAAASLAGGYLFITYDRGPQNPPIQPTAPVSGTFNRPDSGLSIVVPALETATAEPSPTPNPTEVPAATATSTPFPTETPQPIATATATEVAKSAENPLPRYSVFFGNVTDPETGAKRAEMLMASIPQKEGLDQVFMFWITSRYEDGSRSYSGGQSIPRNIKGTHFEFGGPGSIWEKADYNPEEETVEGITYSTVTDKKLPRPIPGGPTNATNESKFKLQLVGEGKEDIFKTMRRIIRNMSSDKPITLEGVLTSLRLDSKVSLWP